MNIYFDLSVAENYKSNSQKARVLTEDWVKRNSYCPVCGAESLNAMPNNSPVADFACHNCREEFELKSKNAISFGSKIADGAFSTMIDRIQADNNPNFFFLTYDKRNSKVTNFMLVPKHFMTENMIEKRNPLPSTARRAGWIGCNISLAQIPNHGKIYLIQNGISTLKERVINHWQNTLFLRKTKHERRGWLLDIMKCLDQIPKDIFNLQEMYKFETELKKKYPNNNFVKDKIRQQLQYLRDQGIIEFLGNGNYKKVQNENL